MFCTRVPYINFLFWLGCGICSDEINLALQKEQQPAACHDSLRINPTADVIVVVYWGQWYRSHNHYYIIYIFKILDC